MRDLTGIGGEAFAQYGTVVAAFAGEIAVELADDTATDDIVPGLG